MRQPLRARTARVLAVVAIVGAVLAPATAVARRRPADPAGRHDPDGRRDSTRGASSTSSTSRS